MRLKTILVILLAASLAGNAAFLITTFFRRPAQHSGAIEKLALTADQTAKFKGTKRAFRDEQTRAHQRMAELRGVLTGELGKAIPDRARLLNAALEMAQVQAEMRPKLIDHLLALHALLTPTQRAALSEIMRSSGGENGAACPGAVFYEAEGR